MPTVDKRSCRVAPKLDGERPFYLASRVASRHRAIAELYDQGRIRTRRETGRRPHTHQYPLDLEQVAETYSVRFMSGSTIAPLSGGMHRADASPAAVEPFDRCDEQTVMTPRRLPCRRVDVSNSRSSPSSLDRDRFGKTGFSLVEVMVAMVVFLIAATGLAQLLAMTTQIHLQAQNTTEAKRLAQGKYRRVDDVRFRDRSLDPGHKRRRAECGHARLFRHARDWRHAPADGTGDRQCRRSRGAHRRPDNGAPTIVTRARTWAHV